MESTVVTDLIALVGGYVLGSIPFGLILTALAGHGDVRAIGSGNIGATNVLRTGNKKLAAATLLGDLLKGTAAVLLARYFIDDSAGLIAGFGAFLGHIFPVWLNFKGGKGVATYIGVLLAADWRAALAYGGLWCVIAAIFRYSSLAGLLACLATPPILFWLNNPPASILFVLLTALVWFKHRANIARLFNGNEPKIGAPK